MLPSFFKGTKHVCWNRQMKMSSEMSDIGHSSFKTLLICNIDL